MRAMPKLAFLLSLLAFGTAAEDMTWSRWDGSSWTSVGGGAISFAVAPDGTPWVVIAIQQVVDTATAEQELTAELEAAKEPVELEDLLENENGRLQLTYYWASMLDTASGRPDTRLAGAATQAWEAARASNYAGPDTTAP